MLLRWSLLGSLIVVRTLLAGPLGTNHFPEPVNTELAGNPISAADAAKSFHLPEGFKVSVFASEPDVRQPIAMTTDSQGRLWVGENYTYGDSKEGYQTNNNDRIVILEDTDHDGQFDKRTVFSDQLKMLTSIEVGMGGVYALCPPRLLFLPMKDGVASGETQVLLEGFDNVSAGRHTFPNGLKWGPDGWLWGRIGISTGAHVTNPHIHGGESVEMRGGIWRMEPRTHRFEAVCHGTTNPWGLDWDEYGEPFFINTVIGHLWHAIPGAHFRRMHGEDVNPHSYQLIDQHADHYHFDTGAGWTKSRAASDGSFAAGSDSLGGGHAHAGLLIYQGDNWPAQYRNKLFTLNLHGRRINQERLERSGSGYVARHEPDLLAVGDTWFRGLDLIESQDGGVFVSDWSDTGECHENDGVHRTSGRIYKITYGTPAPPKVPDLKTVTNKQLVALAFDHDEWYSRHARAELRDRLDRQEDGRDFKAIRKELLGRYNKESATTAKLRALWALNTLHAASPEWLLEQTRVPDEHIRSWAVRLLVDWIKIDYNPQTDDPRLPRIRSRFREMSESDPSAFLRLYLAGELPRMDRETAAAMAVALLQHPEDATDHNLPLLIWYGIEPLIAKDGDLGVILARHSRLPQVTTLITRRLAENLEKYPGPLNFILEDLKKAKPGDQLPTLYGLSAALRGLKKCTPPHQWKDFAASTIGTPNAELHAVVDSLSIVFGDGRPLEELRAVVSNTSQSPIPRRDAIKTLVANRADNLAALLRSQLTDSFIRAPALVGLLELGETNAAGLALGLFKNLDTKEKDEVLAALVSRPASASALLEAMAQGTFPKSILTPFHARQILGYKDPVLTKRMGEVWGLVKTTDETKRKRMAELELIVHPLPVPQKDVLLADLPHGRQLFDQLCATCHRLYGQGRDVGPDLTGSGRQHSDYLINNIVDPNALVPAEYRMNVITLKDGRVFNGIVHPSGDHAISVATPADSITIDRKEIESTEVSDQSMMPEGLLDGLKGKDIKDLLSYLMSNQQVELPGK